MQAIILAAGMGKRLGNLTKENTKCMVGLSGKTIIERMLGQLDGLGFSRIVLVIGYEGAKLRDYVCNLGLKTPIEYVENDRYFETNNIYSLYLARGALLEDDTLLLESDIVFEDGVLGKILEDSSPNLALVAGYENWMDGTVVTIDEDMNIMEFISKDDFVIDSSMRFYKTVNIYKLSREFSASKYIPFLEAYCNAMGNNEYYEQVLKVIVMLGNHGMKACLLEGEKWYEIDDAQDLDIAETIFESDAIEKLNKFKRTYGGYWRYPGLLDFCYLANPYYPPARLLDEMKSSFNDLATRYPSGMDVNSMLAGKLFGLRADLVCVGNGAAELITSLSMKIPGKVGIIYPGFEEYANRIGSGRIVSFEPAKPLAGYSAKEIKEHYRKSEIESLIIVNPDNPTGNSIGREGIEDLIEWSSRRGIRIVVDESFVDFAEDEGPVTLLEEEVLDRNPHLAVVKSISKSYGIPGLRLGVLASGDEKLIKSMKKEVSIWNINSLAECFLQIQGKYCKEYQKSLSKVKEARLELLEGLSAIEQLNAVQSGANFIMCGVNGPFSAEELSAVLLCRYNMLIKDLTGKKGIAGEKVRIAVRSSSDNKKLLEAIDEIYEAEREQDVEG